MKRQVWNKVSLKYAMKSEEQRPGHISHMFQGHFSKIIPTHDFISRLTLFVHKQLKIYRFNWLLYRFKSNLLPWFLAWLHEHQTPVYFPEDTDLHICVLVYFTIQKQQQTKSRNCICVVLLMLFFHVKRTFYLQAFIKVCTYPCQAFKQVKVCTYPCHSFPSRCIPANGFHSEQAPFYGPRWEILSGMLL